MPRRLLIFILRLRLILRPKITSKSGDKKFRGFLPDFSIQSNNETDGWKLKHIGDIKPGVWIVDGKRVDPSKPYDPDAPAYNSDKNPPDR